MKNSVFICLLASLFLASGLIQADPVHITSPGGSSSSDFYNELGYYEDEVEEGELDLTDSSVHAEMTMVPLLQIVNNENVRVSFSYRVFDSRGRAIPRRAFDVHSWGRHIRHKKDRIGMVVKDITAYYTDDFNHKKVPANCPKNFRLGSINSIHITPSLRQCYVIVHDKVDK